MKKNIIFASLIIIITQTVMAFNLDDVNSAANSASEASNTAQKASDTAEKVNTGSVTGMGKQVVTDTAKGGANGAVEGVISGSIVDGGTKGATDGAKSSLDKLGL